MDLHLLLNASKEASIDTQKAGIEGFIVWFIHHISLFDGVLKFSLSLLLVGCAFLRFVIAALRFYYTLKNKGANGD